MIRGTEYSTQRGENNYCSLLTGRWLLESIMKILLIAPDRYWGKHRDNLKTPAILAPPLGLLAVAALTPPDIEVSLIDERVENIKFESDVNLVGMSVLTADAPRAYEIADNFRKRGVKVVLGGMHVSVLPYEALNHSDSVVVGEAEELWPQLLSDFKRGTLKRIYSSTRFPNLSLVPPARTELLRKGVRYIDMVQTTRGCRYNCNFCSVSSIQGRTIRARPVDKVIEEIKKLNSRSLYIVDDNILAKRSYAQRLFEALTPLKKSWLAQASFNLLNRENHLLKIASRAGCKGIFIGLESISPSNLKEVNKTHNVVSKYREVIKKIHDFGLGVIGSFMFGFDGDDSSSFSRTLEFVRRVKIDLASFTLLTPFPGTELYRQMKKGGRIIERNWAKYDCAHVVFKPKKISPKELQQGLNWMYKEFYRLSGILTRTIHGLRYMRLFLPLNLAYRVVGKKGVAQI